MSDVTQRAQDDSSETVGQPSPPAVQLPASHPTQNASASTAPIPVSLDFLAQYYHTGEYADLEIVSNGVERSVHKIIVCSQSPVIKQKCSLGWGYRVELNQYDPETLDRVLDFCYRRTYSDGEYPETVASFLTTMTAEDVRDALEAPLVVISDVEDPEWTADCLECGDSDEEDDDGEYLPYVCDINSPLDFDLETVDEEEPLVNEPFESQAIEELSQPPYEINLFANLKVYVAAKELQIPSLQLLARERIAHSLRSHWARFADLPALIEQIYLRTVQNDPLRALVCQIVAAGYDNEYETDFKAEITELMVRNGRFATEVLDTVLRMKKEWADMN